MVRDDRPGVVRVRRYAACLACEWRSEGESADKDAEKHTADNAHPTVSSSEPAA